MPRLIGPSSRGGAAPRRRPARPALGHDHLLPVGEPGGQVDRFQLGPGAGAARPLHRVLDPAPGRQPVDAGARDRPGHVDDDVARLAAEA